jgi:hypothetical protein
MLKHELMNPDGNFEHEERPFAVPEDAVFNWTEHYAFFAYDAAADAGVFIHIGRVPKHQNIWRGVLQVYQPGGELLVGKYFGADGDADSAGAGPLKVTCIEPFWHFRATFEGMLQRVTRRQITGGVLADMPSEFCKFSIDFHAASPIMGRQSDIEEGRTDGKFHTEQIGRISGVIETDEKRFELNGMGVRDHSHGPRNYGPVVGHLWIHALFPSGRTFSSVFYRQDKPEFVLAYLTEPDGTRYPLEIVSAPWYVSADTPAASVVSDPVSDPQYHPFRIEFRANGKTEVLEGEPRNTHAITYVAVMEELCGTDFSRPEAVQMADAPAVFRLSGETGMGLFERSARIVMLKKE